MFQTLVNTFAPNPARPISGGPEPPQTLELSVSGLPRRLGNAGFMRSLRVSGLLPTQFETTNDGVRDDLRRIIPTPDPPARPAKRRRRRRSRAIVSLKRCKLQTIEQKFPQHFIHKNPGGPRCTTKKSQPTPFSIASRGSNSRSIVSN